jgi:16S rRNA (guanine527-N7)-methyltransferase
VPSATSSSVLEDFSLRLGFSLTPDAISRIDRFIDTLELWNHRLRLTGEQNREQLISHHVADALACVPLLPEAGEVLDLGTGAGFPGVVLACVRPDLTVTLLDSRQRPVSFLNEVIRVADLPAARTMLLRAEDAARDKRLAGRQTLVTSRAIRPDTFFPLAKPLLTSGGLAVSMQTPAVSPETIRAMVAPLGLQLIELRDYRLPDGDPRRLVVCRVS